MKTSNELSEIAAALVEAQSEIQGVSKDGAGNRGKKYMTLDAILSEVKPVLYQHDLTLIQSVTGSELGGIGVTTRVLHKSGQWIEDTSMFPLDDSGNKSDVQGAGSSITYQRRYAVAAFFGIVADEDNDGRRPEVKRNTTTAGNHTIVNNPPKRSKQPAPKRNSAVKEIMGLVDGLGVDLMEGAEIVHPKYEQFDIADESTDYLFTKSYVEFNEAFAAQSDYYDDAHHVFGTIKKLYDGQIQAFDKVKAELPGKLEAYAASKPAQA